MSARTRSVFLGALGTLLLACASVPLTLHEGTRAFTPSEYPSVYNSWTKESSSFSFGTLQDVLSVSATFESWEFRWAYLVRYAHDHGLTTAERQRLLDSSLTDARATHRFFVTLAGPDWRESDLSSERSAWRVFLVDDRGRRTAPALIEKVEHPSQAERVYFPSVSKQRWVFRISVPAVQADGTPTIAPSAPFVILRFTGALGAVDLQWDFD